MLVTIFTYLSILIYEDPKVLGKIRKILQRRVVKFKLFDTKLAICRGSWLTV